MTDLIDREALKKEFPKDEDWDYPVNTNSYVCEKIDEQPTVDAIPIKWLTAQAENPSNSDELRNAIDYIVYTLWAKRKEE